MSPRDLGEPPHVRELPVQVDGQQETRRGRDRRLERLEVEVVVVLAGVDEHRASTGLARPPRTSRRRCSRGRSPRRPARSRRRSGPGGARARPLATPTQCSEPQYAANAASNSPTARTVDVARSRRSSRRSSRATVLSARRAQRSGPPTEPRPARSLAAMSPSLRMLVGDSCGEQVEWAGAGGPRVGDLARGGRVRNA